ncbi:hypothetical protein BDS110ZK4_40690 [Bradyrhizobium diazoefficiens]|uniref:Uncharacterized protein n=1 Tax=Bradyrhizobium diazoefficiens TaxID=1355477 RepID=A0A809ZQK2_9BRAD|nr:hypothetical protein XF1B_80130 [Bradyrhizobium diazoefficiens]BCE51591.1 hypothetical protein XF4B_79400 [Bradyrhizobium diazoefficiens]BCE95087.1 hypothetical protein XF10B_78850 [Bradyrhizobium diazoefficiens]BCF30033.1 hypothetical protein XF14B_79850 [Bradyrhizobium diazoefficiens]
MPLFEIRSTEFKFDGGELPLHDSDQEVSAPASRLQKAGVNALSLALDEVEHCFDHPRRGEYLPMVGDPFLGFDHEARIVDLAGPRLFLNDFATTRYAGDSHSAHTCISI